MKYFEYSQLLITVVILLGGSHVRGNVPLKKRVNTLEMRVNSIEMRVNTDNTLTRTNIAAIEQDIESLNISLLILEDQICPLKGNAENQRHSMPGQSHSTENDDFVYLTKTVLLAGFADEKKWLRGKAEEFRNELDESLSRIKMDISNYKTEIDVKVKKHKTEMDESLSIIKSNTSNYKREIDVKAEKHQNKTDESLSVIRSDIKKYKTDIDAKFDVLATENGIKVEDLRKHITDKTESQRKALDYLQNQIDTRMTKTEANVEKYLSSIIAKMNKTLHSVEKAFAENITRLMYMVNKCPEGWTSFGQFCYLFSKSVKTYNSAQTECSLKGATVADVESQAENDFLLQLAKNNGHKMVSGNEGTIWIGITDEDVEDEWISERTGTKAKFTNIRSGQPDGGTDQNCMVMGFETPYDKWNDWPCILLDLGTLFICKRKKK